ncbi:unnamed protein product [Tilletia caries]|nr:unnamed protein product [Tilletia caries]CAD7061342.1 unnamed protein product [Tilletia caries]
MSGARGDPSALVEFIAGTVGGAASLLAGHPFDTIKTRLQSQSLATSSASTSNGAPPVYRNAIDAFRIIVKEEKFIGLYKGIAGPLLGVAVMNASVFGCYSLALRAQLGANTSIEDASLGQIMLAGMASGVMTALITTPIDLLKIRQQNDTRAATSSSPIAILRDIVRRQGITGLFRGYGATCIRDLGYGPYFFTYELINRTLISFHHTTPYPSFSSTTADPSPGPLPSTPPRLSSLELALSGGLAGMVGWASTFWVDTIKTRIQATEKPTSGSLSTNGPTHSLPRSAQAHSRSVQPSLAVTGTAAAARRPNGTVSAESDRLLGNAAPTSVRTSTQQQSSLSTMPERRRGLRGWITRRNEIVRVSQDLYRNGGLRSFWVGIGPTMLRAIPTNAVLFIVYESTKSTFIDWGY